MTRVFGFITAQLAALLFLAGCQGVSEPEPRLLLTTQTASGSLAGVDQGEVAAYLGIPFGAPPVGDLRWKAPQPVEPWDGVRNADHYGAACIQKRFPDGIPNSPWTKEYMADPNGEFSEDCLYLNVWTPVKSTDERLPVFYWIYGGGFNQGAASLPLYSGAEVAKHGVVFVSANYRVGALGLMAHPELTAEAGTSGNYAITDMIAGLEWVRDNIASFGGDPSRVTIAGQSAGASGVHNLIDSPKAKGLFRGAIPESGSRAGGRGSMTLEQAEAQGTKFMKAAGAATLAELRAMSAEDAQAALEASGMRFRPIVDGVIVPLSASEAYAQGKYNDTPVMTGFTADEGSSSETYGQDTKEQFQASVRERYGDLAGRFLELYPAPDDAAAGEAAKQLARDANIASMYLWANARMDTTQYPIYLYLFTHTMPGPKSERFGAFHSVELAYVFNTLDVLSGRTFAEADDRVAAEMIGYWTNFVTTGDPNGGALPTWPKLDLTNKLIMELAEAPAPREVLSAEKLALFEEAAGR